MTAGRRVPKVIVTAGLSMLMVAVAVAVAWSAWSTQSSPEGPGSRVTPTAAPSTAAELPGPAQRTEWVPVESTHLVTYRVDADGPAQVVYGIIGAEQTSVTVTEDWSLSLTLPDADSTVRVWVTGTGATELACEILIDGERVVERSGFGEPPEAVCAAQLQISG